MKNVEKLIHKPKTRAQILRIRDRWKTKSMRFSRVGINSERKD